MSLVEILVTLFVVAIGLISLMTLFPVGAMQMGQALRDDRIRQTAGQADGMTRIWWQTQVVDCIDPKPGVLSTYTSASNATLTMAYPDHGIMLNEIVDVSWSGGSQIGMTVVGVGGSNVTVSGGGVNPLPPATTPVAVKRREDWFWQALDNPNDPNPPTLAQPLRLAIDSSYPVVLDPIGWQSGSVAQRDWLAGASGNIPRRTTRPMRANPPLPRNTLSLVTGACSLQDDITFFQTGVPDTASGNGLPGSNIVRDGGYNWCSVIQRPINSNRYTADLKILVFHTKGLYGGHIPGLTQPGSEQVFPAAGVKNNTQIDLPPGAVPFLRSGSWILDGSNSTVANFYRVQSITDIGGGNIRLELDTPLKFDVTQVYLLKGLADVFDRPQLTQSGFQVQVP